MSRFALCGTGSGTAFLPTGISNLVGWWDPSQVSSVTKDGSNNVSQINDLSGGAKHATAAGGAMPTWTASSINGLAALSFEGTANYLSANALAATFAGSDVPISIFVVVKLAATADAHHTFVAITKSGVDTATMQILSNSAGTYWSYRRDDAAASVSLQGGTTNLVAHVVSDIFAGTVVDTSVDSTSVITAQPMDVGVTTLDTLTIGAKIGSSTGNYMKGLLGEILIYSRAVTGAEQLRIEKYLRNKWGTA